MNTNPRTETRANISSARPFAWLAVFSFLGLLFFSSIPPALGQTSLYNFSGGSDGGHPTSSLTFDSAGNLYGTTETGGLGYGTVFELSPDGVGGWTETVLYSFTGGADGAAPTYSNVIFDSAGSLYGTTRQGGFKHQGVVFKLTPSDGTWSESVLHSFAGSKNEGCFPESGLIMDKAGNLYGTTHYCGGTRGTVFELSPSDGNIWTERIIYGAKTSYAGLTMDAQGNIFGTTRDNTVFELSPNGSGGWSSNVIHTFPRFSDDGGDPQGTLVFDSAGNIYGTTYNRGISSGRGFEPRGTVYKLSPVGGGWSEQILYTFECCRGGIFNPFAGVVLDGSGNIYGTTVHGFREIYGGIFELVPSGGGSYTKIDLGLFGSSGFGSFGSLVMDNVGNLYGTLSYGGGGMVFEVVP